METILALLDDLSRDLARANADLEKFDSDVVTMSERLDQMESRRNSRAFTPETLLPMTNPPRPPHNATSQAPNSLQNREQDGPLPPQVDQVQQGGLGSQFPPIQAPQPKLHITKSSLSTESSLSQNRHIQEEEHGRERHEGYGVYDDAYMIEGDLSRMRLKANLKRERMPRVKMKMLDPRLFVIMLSGLASLWTIFVHLLWAVFSSFFDTSLVIIKLSSSSCFANCFEWFLLK
ncbi:uncharacterized protein LOC124888696 [Capsicum annuum]|uniref:uncharacterized protein LOC124888696 n=1 Tax=Capsicum annuum TaxID=4072 RepID=UPI001FB0F01F|nr:uncharacterized protein LOC124888696 [Capsicum annuum]